MVFLFAENDTTSVFSTTTEKSTTSPESVGVTSAKTIGMVDEIGLTIFLLSKRLPFSLDYYELCTICA